MSFNVKWDSVETESLVSWTKDLLTEALNSGKTPPILASAIEIKDLNFGKIAPNFEILEIGELEKDRFRGIFKISYSGDFHLTLHTKVQANPLKIYSSNSLERELNNDNEAFITPHFLMANDPFALPLDLKLSDIKINGIGIIVFSKSKGLTLVFRNDPLDSIKVSSTFDTVQVLANFLQTQIETQIRDLFRETLPTILHQLSLKYTSINQNDILNLNPKASRNHESATFDPNVAYSPEFLQQNLNLFNSKDSLKLNIPKLKNIIQRTRFEKFHKETPSLSNSLSANLKLADPNISMNHSNGIPIEYLTNYDHNKMNDILKEVTKIQANNYYRVSGNNVKPKRRTIKLNTKNKHKSEPEEQDTSMSNQSISSDASNSSTLVDQTESTFEDVSIGHNLRQPMPVKALPDMTPHPLKPINNTLLDSIEAHSGHPLSPSVNSLLGTLGLGNNYFNFNSHPISTSPIRSGKVQGVKNKKSINYMNINKINKKLDLPLSIAMNNEKLSKSQDKTYGLSKNELSKNELSKNELSKNELSKIDFSHELGKADSKTHEPYELPPPPYYQRDMIV